MFFLMYFKKCIYIYMNDVYTHTRARTHTVALLSLTSSCEFFDLNILISCAASR